MEVVPSKRRSSARSWLTKGNSPNSHQSIFSDLNMFTRRNAVVENGNAVPVGAGTQGLEAVGGGGVPRVQPLPTTTKSQQGALTTPP